MAAQTTSEIVSATPERVVLLTVGELRTRYAVAAAQARLLAILLRIAERESRRGPSPVAVPVRVRRKS